MNPRKVLFVGQGRSAICYYRCTLPAMFMGADWCGIAGEPPHIGFLTGLVDGQTKFPAMDSYDVVVLQSPRGKGWLKIIRDLQERGVKVIFEIDDYVHAIRKMKDHDFAEGFQRDGLKALELNMRVCDAMICSTDYIARRYREFNPHTYVCRNCLDLGRYALTRPERPTVNIGWAGATGHKEAVRPWLVEVGKTMAEREATAFVSVGYPYADYLKPHFGPRAISIPWTLVDIYPSAMTMFDIALAPAGKGNFFKGKSDLRWLEAGALGVPIIADPVVYPAIEHGVDGFHAETPERCHELLLELIDNPTLRLEVGAAAKEYVLDERDMRVGVKAWEGVLEEVLAA